MSLIHILPAETANRIAAGEVVERPASVVKELIENAVDAGATRVAIRVEEGGRRLIQVSDDGCGMDRDDALLCIEAHATSKIQAAFDIDRIHTLGFRGEALASIAAVSHFQLQTRRADDLCGTEILVEGGQLRDVRDCGCAPGTNVRVRNLFFNLPARRKFLRQPATEDAHIQETVLMQALAHAAVAFELSLNDQTVLQAHAGGDPAARIGMLLGRDVYDGMIPVDYHEAGISVTGFVARPGVTRPRRRDQRSFINGRPAEAEAVYQGLREAYHTLVVQGRYPPAVLYVNLPPETVDVNVHPTKREVRFRDGMLVSQIVAAAVRRSLRGLAAPAPGEPRPPLAPPTLPPPPMFTPALRTPQTAPADDAAAPMPTHPAGQAPPPTPDDRIPAPAPTGLHSPGRPTTLPPGADDNPDLAPAPLPTPPAPTPPASPAPPSAVRTGITGLRVLGMLQSRCLVAEGDAGLVLIDQRAAHERILFERLLAAARSRQGVSQPLLLPVTVELPPAEAELLQRHAGQFSRIGFEIESFGGGTVLITAIPANIPQENLASLLRDILDDLREGVAGALARPDEIALAQAAARHAVRLRTVLSPDEIERLLADLARCELPYTCPQGRPVMVNIPYSEIERRFGRRGS